MLNRTPKPKLHPRKLENGEEKRYLDLLCLKCHDQKIDVWSTYPHMDFKAAYGFVVRTFFKNS